MLTFAVYSAGSYYISGTWEVNHTATGRGVSCEDDTACAEDTGPCRMLQTDTCLFGVSSCGLLS